MPQLLQTVTLSEAAVNLTTVGAVDWSDWSGSSGSVSAVDWKLGAGHTIPNPSVYGATASLGFYYSGGLSRSWTDGTNTSSSTDSGGIYVDGTATGVGFQFVIPADTNVRTIYLYLRAYAATSAAVVSTSISDGSSSTKTDSTTITSSGGVDAVVEIVYQAASAGQSITVTYTTSISSSNVALQAAALASVVAPSFALEDEGEWFQYIQVAA